MAFLRVLVCFTSLALVSADKCDHLGILLYEDLGCTPEYDDPKSCPTKYSCSGLESAGQCVFRGRTYQGGERISDNLTYPACDVGCFCPNHASFSDEEKKDLPPTILALPQIAVHFTCAVLDCPEWLGSPINPGCYRTYSLDSCCSTGQKCGPFDKVEKCLVDGHEYKEGERFYPKNTCLKCVCHKGFKGIYEEPFCQRIHCNVQLRRNSAANVQQNCAPLYDKSSEKVLCCPSSWVCPDGSEDIKGTDQKGGECKFGNKIVKIGQSFEKLNIESSYGKIFDKVSCKCVIPPLLTCNEV